MKDWINKIHCGDALAVLKEMPDKFVDMVMCSPPYWGLRCYGTEGQIWDGGKNCEHIWGSKVPRAGYRISDTNPGALQSIATQNRDIGFSNFCQKCGAWRGELGLEPDFDLYIKHLCDIFDEIKRVLKDTGTIWINLGDTYNGSGGAGNQYSESRKRHTAFGKIRGGIGESLPTNIEGYPTKCLCMIPQRFAIEMVNRGWILRNTIIWYKPNCMPSSAADRFTVDFEYLFFFTKSSETQYWTNEKTFESISKQPLGIKGSEGKDWEWRNVGSNYSECNTKISFKDAENLSSPRARVHRGKKQKKMSLWTGHDYYFEQQFEGSIRPGEIGKFSQKWHANMNDPNYRGGTEQYGTNRKIETSEYRNKRCVWGITTHSFPESHFAVYPEELCITPIKAGCPEFICKRCGMPREIIYEDGEFIQTGGGRKKETPGLSENQKEKAGYVQKNKKKLSDCGCGTDFHPGIVLDPFSGAGTSCLTAKKLGRQYIGIEINSEYVNMSERRIHNQAGLL